ncbi:ABC transporter permease [Lysinibacillus sp. HST-98]|uniref:oligopeptide ABC transporter permease n=1 Tax=Lysinibacillus TaxID=400634 RepID=UPI0001DA57B7|nr:MULTISPECIES: oligopeptide ABC transporter permease [Lysinibacillus]EFI69210.1 oligopeptide transport system permease protein [Lysinibacillus fusiformis ZC1]EKU41724.1 oligopeptide transport system permease protein [Lysinibacillus fusiformis ZB2]AUS85660.1 ABC transporter permease [Lysinibacillus sp. YS11]MBL3731049.1 ABC transporter permease [Lysinibacillus sp. HST-98]MBU5251654.1 ABC transporter permease [Lysinibacillus capsici]
MWKTIVRRVILMIPQMFVLSLIIFVLAKQMPGDPFTGLITPETDPARIEELRIQAGYYDPWYIQYYHWVINAFQGDFGQSYTYKLAVSTLIGERALNTFWLALLSTILVYLIAIPLGMIAGRKQDTLYDKSITLYSFISYAIPTFVLGLIFLYIFGYRLMWFPTSGTVDVGVEPGTLEYYWNRLYHLILPAMTYAILATTTIIQYLRSEIIDAKTQDYVKTARSKGVPMKIIYRRHIFRNSLLPIAAFLGFTITGLLGGSIFIETIFGFPGMGQLFIHSVTSRDYSVITALVMLYGFLALLGSLLSDIIMSIVDPRIRID